MKKIVYGILIAAAMLVPTRPQELGKLKPVELIRVEKDGDMILIETDTGDAGRGLTVNQALWDLQATTAGLVYLDTAEFLLISGDGTACVDTLRPYLKESVRICMSEGEMKLEEVAAYLNIHKPGVQLKEYQNGVLLQTLASENGRLNLREKNVERRQKIA